MARAKGKRKVKRELSPAQKHAIEKRAFTRGIRTIFDKAGFRLVKEVCDAKIDFEGRAGDFDDVFIYENVVTFVEYTVANPGQVGDHIKGKVHLFERVNAQPLQFIEQMREQFPTLRAAIPDSYHPAQLIVRILYCSKSEIKTEHQNLSKGTKFLWLSTIRYFRALSDTIKRSARFEIFDFLGIDHSEVGSGGLVEQGTPAVAFSGSVLPEAHSNFPPGFKVISFYVSPAAVLSRAYVLRKDGWRDSEGLYQRMIDRRKIEKIRRHLRENERVFVNNVILTLPDDTKLLDSENSEIDPSSIHKTIPITVQLPNRGNTVGIVDGQHRIFSYYEDATDDAKIAVYRSRQNLLATGIMYPNNYKRGQRERFEAGLFLEINSTQNAAKSNLKQAIALITEPYSPDSVGKRVVQQLGMFGAMEDLLERHFFDTGVLKTTTIVSYGLRPLVRIDGEESLFGRWGAADSRSRVQKQQSLEDLTQYAIFCASEINKFLCAARAVVGSKRWILKVKGGDGLLTVTFINGLLVLFRQYVKAYGPGSLEQYRSALGPLSSFKFETYKSSQYFAMAEDMFRKAFGTKPRG